jgi:hypothetical protein
MNMPQDLVQEHPFVQDVNNTTMQRTVKLVNQGTGQMIQNVAKEQDLSICE